MTIPVYNSGTWHALNIIILNTMSRKRILKKPINMHAFAERSKTGDNQNSIQKHFSITLFPSFDRALLLFLIV